MAFFAGCGPSLSLKIVYLPLPSDGHLTKLVLNNGARKESTMCVYCFEREFDEKLDMKRD